MNFIYTLLFNLIVFCKNKICDIILSYINIFKHFMQFHISRSYNNYFNLIFFIILIKLMMCVSLSSHAENETNLILNFNTSDINSLEQDSLKNLLPEGLELTETLRNTSMPKLKNSRLGQILSRYYNESMGGSDNWNKINSLKVSATYKENSKEYKYDSLARKPNLVKITIDKDEGNYVVAYNGKAGWEKSSNKSDPKEINNKERLRQLSNDSIFMNYLLYPFRKNKSYEYLGVIREAEVICHKIRVHTEADFVMDYYIDVKSYLEVKVVQQDKTSYFEKIELVMSDHKLVEGIYFPFKVETYVEGNFRSVLVIEEVEVNPGIMNWMFDYNQFN